MSLYNPNAQTPIANSLLVGYPPSDTPPVFKTPPKGLWTTGMQTKTCAVIEWGAGIFSSMAMLLHNTDGSQLVLSPTLFEPYSLPPGSIGPIPPPVAAVNALQAAAIEACGPNADVSHEGRHYRVSVNNPNAAIPNPTRLLFRPPQE